MAFNETSNLSLIFVESRLSVQKNPAAPQNCLAMGPKLWWMGFLVGTGQVQFEINERSAFSQTLRSKYPNLAVFHLAKSTTPLPCNSK
ncbi:MAG: hypothetical protein H7833_09380 [Magnetococcus sp. DMHC-1]|nr:hypothetical protein [Magnetococcales bacterium]